MTLPTFSETSIDVVPEVIPQDEAPSYQYELMCQTCGADITDLYSGRGRKPKYCKVHQANKPRTASRVPRGQNESLAASAADVLNGYNSIVTLGALAVGLPETASAMSSRQEPFRDQAFEALKQDPQLCKSIIGVGKGSALVGLIIAYAMLGAGVIPTAVAEVKDKRRAAETWDEN